MPKKKLRIDDCERFEMMLMLFPIEDALFFLKHHQSCPLGIHTKEGLTRRRMRESQPDYIEKLLEALKTFKPTPGRRSRK